MLAHCKCTVCSFLSCLLSYTCLNQCTAHYTRRQLGSKSLQCRGVIYLWPMHIAVWLRMYAVRWNEVMWACVRLWVAWGQWHCVTSFFSGYTTFMIPHLQCCCLDVLHSSKPGLAIESPWSTYLIPLFGPLCLRFNRGPALVTFNDLNKLTTLFLCTTNNAHHEFTLY